MVLSNEIRLLDLLPRPSDDHDAPIKCEIRTVSLAAKPDYEALSYVWGNQINSVDIEVSGQRVSVTQNLLAGLKRLRLAHEKRSLWIDQLCINQWDTQEKAKQVRLMRDIYTNCRSCQIWMGEVEEHIPLADAEQALEFIKYMAAAADADDAEDIPKPASFESSETFEGPMKALQTLAYEIEIENGNPWWVRVWTVQEATLPPQVYVNWGPFSVPWESLYKSTRPWVGDCNVPWEVWELLSTPNTSFLGSMMAMIIWLEIARERDDGPAEMITRWRYRRATDPRDKIYALLGLCQPGSLPAVETCNYDLPPVEVFCTLTIDLMLSEEGLYALILDPRLPPEKATPGIPRWAIDVADLSPHNTDWYHLYSYGWYNACADRYADLGAIQTRARQGHKTLELKGVLVDTVEKVGEPFYKPFRDGEEADHIHTGRLRSWEALAKEHVKRGTPDSSELYPGEYTLREAFARLMMGNLIRDGNQNVEDWAEEEHVDRFYSHLEGESDDDLRLTINGMMKNQTFFVTKTGLIGMGHLDTLPGDEVWIFHGGRVPFTVTPRKGDDNAVDFGGRCYVEGIMMGEVFEDDEEPVERVVTIY